MMAVRGALLLVCLLLSTSSAYISNYDPSSIDDLTSSLWCQGNEHQDHRHCSFQNLCYSRSARQFLFFHSDKSHVSGLSHPDEQRQMVRLSGGMATDSRSTYLDYVTLPASASRRYKVDRVDTPTLIMSRRSASDIQKVILDDVLSIYLTMAHLCFGDPKECFRRFGLAVVEDYEEESRFNFAYSMFFERSVLWLDRATSKEDLDEDRIVCFSKAIVGMDHSGYVFKSTTVVKMLCNYV